MRELRVWEESVEGMAVVDIRWQVAIISAIHLIKSLRGFELSATSANCLSSGLSIVRSVFDRKTQFVFHI